MNGILELSDDQKNSLLLWNMKATVNLTTEPCFTDRSNSHLYKLYPEFNFNIIWPPVYSVSQETTLHYCQTHKPRHSMHLFLSSNLPVHFIATSFAWSNHPKKCDIISLLFTPCTVVQFTQFLPTNAYNFHLIVC